MRSELGYFVDCSSLISGLNDSAAALTYRRYHGVDVWGLLSIFIFARILVSDLFPFQTKNTIVYGDIAPLATRYARIILLAKTVLQSL